MPIICYSHLDGGFTYYYRNANTDDDLVSEVDLVGDQRRARDRMMWTVLLLFATWMVTSFT